MGEGGEADALGAQIGEQLPIQRKAGRGRLEGRRPAGDARPAIPGLQRLAQMGILDRAAMPRDPGPDRIGRTVEGHKHELGMAQSGFDRRGERPEDKPVAAEEQRRRRPIFRADPPIAGAEDDRRRTDGRHRGGAMGARRGGARSALAVGRWMPARLAGMVAASLAITRSPGRSSPTRAARRRWVMRPSASTARSLASFGRWMRFAGGKHRRPP